jgi:hypothetical protein
MGMLTNKKHDERNPTLSNETVTTLRRDAP